jgi:gamma-glutamylcyclotransferase (GGCT)/AIG2-like uncharacterized protein YtfP
MKAKPERWILYFAYGSNLAIDRMQARCPDAQPVVQAKLKGWKLTFRGVADVVTDPSSTVFGALYWISEADLLALDQYEGYRRSAPLSGLYRREWVKATLNIAGPNGSEKRKRTVSILFYAMNRERKYPPMGGYLDVIRDGYRDWSLPMEHLDAAIAECSEGSGGSISIEEE